VSELRGDGSSILIGSGSGNRTFLVTEGGNGPVSQASLNNEDSFLDNSDEQFGRLENTIYPSSAPSLTLSVNPTDDPTQMPTTMKPSSSPTAPKTISPSTWPSVSPSQTPTDTLFRSPRGIYLTRNIYYIH